MLRRVAFSLCLVWAMVITVPALAAKADDTLRVAWGPGAPPESVDFYFNTTSAGKAIGALIWDTLVWRDPTDFSYHPLLAKAWRRVDDATLEFDLRDDVSFQDGTKLTAADVVGTVNIVANPGFKVLVPRNVNWIATAVQTGTYQVRIISKGPFAPALDYIANALPIYPAEHYAAVGPERMGEHPIGTGPYRMLSIDPGKAYRLGHNDSYFKGGPKGDRFIRTIEIRAVPKAQERAADLVAHRVDLVWGLDNGELPQFSDRAGFKVVQSETMRIAWLALDAAGRSGVPALQSVDVRRAIAHAVNRQEIMQSRTEGPAFALDAPCYPKVFGCLSEAAHHYDHAPDKSRDLLHAWGYEGKVAFDFYTEASMQAMAEIVQSDLAKVGITARLQIVDGRALREAELNDRASLVLQSSDADGVNDVSAMLDLPFGPGRLDYARDPDLHSWLEDAEATSDVAKRKGLYAKAIERITDQVYWLPLFVSGENYAFTDQVAVTPSIGELVTLYRIHWN